MEQEQFFTEYDTLVHSQEIQILKSILPFIDTNQQMSFAILIQFIEFKNTIQIFQKNKNILSAHAIAPENDGKNAMLTAIKKFISPSQRETFDNMMNLISMMNLMNGSNDMSGIMSMMGGSDDMSGIMSMMGGSNDMSGIMSMMGSPENMTDFKNIMNPSEDIINSPEDIMNIKESMENNADDFNISNNKEELC